MEVGFGFLFEQRFALPSCLRVFGTLLLSSRLIPLFGQFGLVFAPLDLGLPICQLEEKDDTSSVQNKNYQLLNVEHNEL